LRLCCTNSSASLFVCALCIEDKSTCQLF